MADILPSLKRRSGPGSKIQRKLSSFSTSADFGVANWGDSFESVLQNETKTSLTPLDSSTYLIYDAPMLGLTNVRLIYFFNNNKLHKGAYVFYDLAAKTNDYFHRFQTINDMVSKKNGTANDDLTLYQDNGNELSQSDALMQNKLLRQTIWSSQQTRIEHQLTEDDGEISHQLIYHSNNVQDSPF